VHFKAINYPLVGDTLYGPDWENDLGFTRLALHSYKVTFATVTGEMQEITASESVDFEVARQLLQK
jgi:23S rRNA-/tRNA-specific pseudouridylate synthase